MASVLAMAHSLPPITEANPLLALIESKLGESLPDLIAERRDEGVSWARIALELYTRTQVYVTGEGIRLWAERAT